jgi:hypothetical protein
VILFEECLNTDRYNLARLFLRMDFNHPLKNIFQATFLWRLQCIVSFWENQGLMRTGNRPC